MAQIDERVVVLDKAQPPVGHLPRQPVVAVDINLHGVGKIRLPAEVHQAEVGVQPVIVQDPLRTAGEDQPRLAFPVSQLHGGARFRDAEDGHQAHVEAVFADQLVDEFLFLESALAIFVGAALLPGDVLAIFDQRFRMPLQPRQKVFPPHPQNPIHVIVQIILAAKRQIALENDPIKTAQQGYNGNGKLLDKTFGKVHGVLLSMAT
jgi:hypothetical protein